MSWSKKHHYVAKAILRNFCFASEATYFLKKDNAAADPEKRNINSIFYRRHYNSYKTSDGRKDDRLERFFGEELDNFIPDWIAVFEKALKTGKITFQDELSRSRFVFFFYHHMKRTPDFVDPLVKSVSGELFSQEGLEDIQKRHRALSEEEIAKFFSKDFQEQVTWNSRVSNMGEFSEKVIGILMKMKILVATPARTKKQFIVGSNPVIRFENHVYQELGTEGVELWTSLTPQIAVGLFTGQEPPSDLLILPDDDVRKFNLQIAKRSSAIASRSPPLLKSLSKAAWSSS